MEGSSEATFEIPGENGGENSLALLVASSSALPLQSTAPGTTAQYTLIPHLGTGLCGDQQLLLQGNTYLHLENVTVGHNPSAPGTALTVLPQQVTSVLDPSGHMQAQPGLATHCVSEKQLEASVGNVLVSTESLPTVSLGSDQHSEQGPVERVISKDHTDTDLIPTLIPQPGTKTKLFSSLHAKLSSAILDVIPGSKMALFQQLKCDCPEVEIHCDVNDVDIHIQDGNLKKLIEVQNSLAKLVQSQCQEDLDLDLEMPEKSLCDKSTLCHILQPLYSRSGREVKQKGADIYIGDDSSLIESPTKRRSRKSNALHKRGKTQAQKIQKEKQILELALSQTFGDITKNSEEVAVSKAELEVTVGTVPETAANEEEEEENNDVDEVTGSIWQTVLEGKPEEGDSNVNKENEITEDSPSEVEKDISSSETIANLSRGTKIGRRLTKKDYESLAPFRFFCDKCSFKTKRESHFLKHKNMHLRNPNLLHCKQCAFTTVRLSHLRRHEIIHSSSLHSCSKCKYKTSNKKLLSRHLRIKHGEQDHREKPKLLPCAICDYSTTKPYLYQRHLKMHMPAEFNEDGELQASSYQCPHCPYKSSRKEHYARHFTNVHTNRRPYLCDLCGKSFKRPDALRQHKVTHLDKTNRDYPFKCPTCMKGFRSQAHMLEHQTMHSNIRAFLCETCGASFKTRSVQRKHEQTIHKHPRAHCCGQCDKRFNTKYALNRHVRTHDTPGMKVKTEMPALPPEIAQQVQVIHVQSIAPGTQIQPIEGAQAIVSQAQITQEAAISAGIEESYENSDAIRQLPQAYIHTNEATTALLYLTSNFHSYG